MKTTLFILITLITLPLIAQENDYYVKKGYAIEGYDVTEYFNNKAVEGSKEFTTEYDGVKFKFVNQENLDKFKKNPVQYLPQYGGYCAYAVAHKNEKIKIDPETFEIRDGKLYLFYNAWGVNTLEKWQKEGPKELQKKADISWQNVSTKN